MAESKNSNWQSDAIILKNAGVLMEVRRNTSFLQNSEHDTDDQI
jgi:hypothetical protein